MTAVSVDPRLRARRIEVKREQGHRRLRRVIVVVAIVGLLFGALMVSRSSLLDVDRIEVYGLDQVSLGAVEEAMDIELGAPLVTLDTAAAADALEALPWVDEVTVRRGWRGTITIEVTERRPVAVALTAPDAWVLVDREGRVLSSVLAQPPALPRLSGVRAAAEPGSFMSEDSLAPLAVAQALPPALREVVYGVWRDGRGELRLGVLDGPIVLLGDDDRLGAKVAAAATMLDQLAEEGVVPATIDVSVPNLPVVRDR